VNKINTVKISNLPRSMQNIEMYLVGSFNVAQLLVGPIIPRPGPIFPMDDAEIAKDEMTSKPFIETTNVHNAKINI